VAFNYTHKKQTGGSGQYGKVGGYIEPWTEAPFRFDDQVVGGAIPREFIPAVEKGFVSMLAKGALIGAPVTGVSITLDDGAAHAVDSSDIAFQEAARGAWRESYLKSAPQILEPLMKVAVEGPTEFQGGVVGILMQRRGIIIGSTDSEGFCRVEAEVPLAEMFGFSTVLRSATQGKAEFTMEFSRYAPLPAAIAEELIKKHREEQAKKGK
jgi:elongation factor G